MISKELIDLTSLAKECFDADIPDPTDIAATVGDIWTLLDLEPRHSIYLSAQLDIMKPNEVLLTVGRTDFQDDLAESLIKKEFYVTKERSVLRVVPYLTELDDHPNNNNIPRLSYSYDYNEELKDGKLLMAEFIQALSFLMKPEDKAALLDNADFKTSSLPIAAALKSGLSTRHTLKSVLGFDEDSPKPDIY